MPQSDSGSILHRSGRWSRRTAIIRSLTHSLCWSHASGGSPRAVELEPSELGSHSQDRYRRFTGTGHCRGRWYVACLHSGSE